MFMRKIYSKGLVGKVCGLCCKNSILLTYHVVVVTSTEIYNNSPIRMGHVNIPIATSLTLKNVIRSHVTLLDCY